MQSQVGIPAKNLPFFILNSFLCYGYSSCTSAWNGYCFCMCFVRALITQYVLLLLDFLLSLEMVFLISLSFCSLSFIILSLMELLLRLSFFFFLEQSNFLFCIHQSPFSVKFFLLFW